MRGAPVPETVRVVAPGGLGLADASWVHVMGTTLRLVPRPVDDTDDAPRAGARPPADAGFDTEALWLTRAERAVLEWVPLDGTRGLGAAVAAVLGSILSPHAGASVALLRHQALVTVRGLLSAAANERIEAHAAPATPGQQLVVRAMQVVNARLDDPSLTSTAVADQLRVSLRTLQAAFRESEAALTPFIGALRLERARLEVSALQTLTRSDVAAVGARWGFRGAAHFARAYERRYGARPGALAAEVSRRG